MRTIKAVHEVLAREEGPGNWWNLIGEFSTREEAEKAAAKAPGKTSITKVFR